MKQGEEPTFLNGTFIKQMRHARVATNERSIVGRSDSEASHIRGLACSTHAVPQDCKVRNVATIRR